MSSTLPMFLVLALLAVACGDDKKSGGDTSPDTTMMDMTTDDGDTDVGDTTDTTADGTDTGDTTDMQTDVCEGQTRCSAVGDIETCQPGGIWATTMQCPNGCMDGQCILPSDPGTCGSPTALALDTPIMGSTDTGFSNNVWNQACTNGYGFRPEGPEQVFALELTAPTWVEFTVTPVDATYYGLYIRRDCIGEDSQIHHACDGNANPGEDVIVTTLLPAGTNFVVVDDFGSDGNGPGAFTLTAAAVSAPSCEMVIPQMLDISSGQVVVQGDTGSGQANAEGHTFGCPAGAFQTLGNENIYSITLDHPSNIRATVEATNPSDSPITVYMRSVCDVRFDQVLCGEADSGRAIGATTEALEPGPYWVFVDDYGASRDGPQEYTLTIDVLD